MIGATVTPTTSSTSSPLHLHCQLSTSLPPIFSTLPEPPSVIHQRHSNIHLHQSVSTSSPHLHALSYPPSVLSTFQRSVASTCSTSVSAHLHRVRLYFQNHDYYSTYSTSPPSPLPLPPPSPPPAMSFRPPPPPPPLLHPVTHLPPPPPPVLLTPHHTNVYLIDL